MSGIQSSISALSRDLAPRIWRALFELRPGNGPLWGEGFVDEGLDCRWLSGSWDCVSDDELVFLLPGLLTVQAASADARIENRLRRALIIRTHWAIDQLQGSPEVPHSRDRRAVLEHLHRVGVLTSIGPEEAWREPEHCAPEASPPPDQSPSLSLIHRRSSSSTERRALAVKTLASVDRLHGDACRPKLERRSISLAAATFASISSGINAAYVYPALVCMHQTMTVGAWLGHLLQGRPALMPMSVAELLLEIAGRADAAYSTDNLIRAHIKSGGSGLLTMARRVANDGRARRISLMPVASRSHAHIRAVLAAAADV